MKKQNKLLVFGLAASLSFPIVNCNYNNGENCYNSEKKTNELFIQKETCLEEKIKDQEVETKKVNLNVYIDRLSEEQGYNDNKKREIFNIVKEFYLRAFIDLNIKFLDVKEYDSFIGERLKTGRGDIENIVLGIFPGDNFEIEHKHMLGYEKKCKAEGIAIISKGVALKESLYRKTTNQEAQSICHEIGHLFGLWHSFNFTDDPVEDYVDHPKKSIPNFMSYRPSNELEDPDLGFGFNIFQVQQMHSFLSKGAVYEEVKKENYDFSRYLNNVKENCNYKEGQKVARNNF